MKCSCLAFNTYRLPCIHLLACNLKEKVFLDEESIPDVFKISNNFHIQNKNEKGKFVHLKSNIKSKAIYSDRMKYSEIQPSMKLNEGAISNLGILNFMLLLNYNRPQ